MNQLSNRPTGLDGKIKKEIAANEGGGIGRDRKARLESCITRKKSAGKSTFRLNEFFAAD